MVRTARIVVPRIPHHIVQHGNDKQLIFRDEEDYLKFYQWMREAARQFKVAIHAYILMGNHVHLLATPSETESLARMMQWLGRFYVPYFNRKYGRSGTLWQGRFRTSLIESERYFLSCSRYIELNPVRAGIVMQPGDYRWSSYAHHVGDRLDVLIADHPIYWALGNTPFDREAAYRQFMEESVSQAEIDELSQAIKKGWVLGSEQFMAQLEKTTNRRMRPAKRGRPPKKDAAAG